MKNRRFSRVVLLALLVQLCLVLSGALAQNNASKDQRMRWFRDAKFGLFVHWGIYAQPAGEWKGKIYPGAAEWLMYRAEIPVKEYEQLAKQFNPTEFDADRWVRLAKEAGMKYVVITAKHHDGFAMYHSRVTKYNIVDATPFKRDPMEELAAACKKYGLKFCFYYSQTQDWHEPNGVGNYWDFDGENPKDFQKYFDEKAEPQLRELLTQYGPLGLIWFDTPRTMTPAQSKELAYLVHKIQPACLVDGRIGNEMGDYKTKGDNRIPTGALETDWETPATMNTSWGFKRSDENWKSTKQLIRALVEIASKGGNYLLNVGPTAEGTIPAPSVERLEQVGQWMKANGESVYGTRMSPWLIPPEWGVITTKPGKVYLHVFEWPTNARLELAGLSNRVRSATLLTDRSILRFRQSTRKALGLSLLTIEVPHHAPDPNVSVVSLEIKGTLDVSNSIQQQQSGTIDLFGISADLHKSVGSRLRKDDTGVRDWLDTSDWLSWKFGISQPGTFGVTLGSYAITSGGGRMRKTVFEGGHQLLLSIAGQNLSFRVDSTSVERPSPYFTDIVSEAGRVSIPAAGIYTLQLRAKQIMTAEGNGCVVRWVRLRPVR
jgi:alpha-L-fucosidase